MGREVVDVRTNRNADGSSGRVHVAPKIAAAAGSETEEEFEVKECTEEDSHSENAPNLETGAQNSPKTPKLSKVKLLSDQTLCFASSLRGVNDLFCSVMLLFSG